MHGPHAHSEPITHKWLCARFTNRPLLPWVQLYQPYPGPGIPGITPALKGCLSGLPNPFRGAALCLMACMGMSVSRNLVPAGAERNTHLIVRDVHEDSPKMRAAR